MQRIIGFDPSMRNWGVAIGLYDEASRTVEITDLDVIRPKVEVRGRKSHQDLNHAMQLATGVFEVMRWYQPAKVYVEVPHGSQSASAMKGYGMCIAILGCCRALNWEFVELTESEVKISAVAKREATKEEMIEWAVKRHQEAPWPTRRYKGENVINKGTAEHMADAVGAIHAGLTLEHSE